MESRPPTPKPEPTVRERTLSGHIFTVSAGLVGVCLTVIGVLNLGRQQGAVQSIADNLLAIDAAAFLSACLFAYLALRAKEERSWLRLERFADALFLVGLSGMVTVGVLVAFDLI